MLATQMKGSPTGDQHRKVRGSFEKPGDCRSRGDQVLEGVQDNQRPSLTEALRQYWLNVARDRSQSDSRRDHRQPQFGIVGLGETEEKGPTRKVHLGRFRDRDGE